MSNRNEDLNDIKIALSVARLSTYENKTRNLEEAFILYKINLEVSSSFLTVLHVCEVVVRNAICSALEKVYGDQWAWSESFLKSLPNPKYGYSEYKDLTETRKHKNNIGSVIADLKFIFWQKLLTSRHDQRLWNQYLDVVFPNYKSIVTPSNKRQQIYNDLNKIRLFRNRIAHHEPIFKRDLRDEYDVIMRLVRHVCLNTYHWLDKNQKVEDTLERTGIEKY